MSSCLSSAFCPPRLLYCLFKHWPVGLPLLLAFRLVFWLTMIVLGQKDIIQTKQPKLSNYTFFYNGTHLDYNWGHEGPETGEGPEYFETIDLRAPFSFWAVGLLPTLLELCVDVAILMPGIFLKSKNFLWTWTVLSHIYLLRGIHYYNFFYRFQNSLRYLTPPIWFYAAVDAFAILLQIHSVCYVQSFLRARRLGEGGPATNSDQSDTPGCSDKACQWISEKYKSLLNLKQRQRIKSVFCPSSLFYSLRCLEFHPYGVGLLVGLRITLWVSLALLGAGRVETDTYPDDGTFPEGAYPEPYFVVWYTVEDDGDDIDEDPGIPVVKVTDYRQPFALFNYFGFGSITMCLIDVMLGIGVSGKFATLLIVWCFVSFLHPIVTFACFYLFCSRNPGAVPFLNPGLWFFILLEVLITLFNTHCACYIRAFIMKLKEGTNGDAEGQGSEMHQCRQEDNERQQEEPLQEQQQSPPMAVGFEPPPPYTERPEAGSEIPSAPTAPTLPYKSYMERTNNMVLPDELNFGD